MLGIALVVLRTGLRLCGLASLVKTEYFVGSYQLYIPCMIIPPNIPHEDGNRIFPAGADKCFSIVEVRIQPGSSSFGFQLDSGHAC